MFSGAVCKKVGSMATVKGQVFVCTKEKSQLKWRPKSSKAAPSVLPSQTPAVNNLPIVPIISLAMVDRTKVDTNSTEGKIEAVPVKASTYLEFNKSVSTLKYFLVINAPRGLYSTCFSGGNRTGNSAPNIANQFSNRTLGSVKFEGKIGAYPIPAFPITMDCYLVEAVEYKFMVVQAMSDNSAATPISKITSLVLPNYVAPTPKPSPTISTSSQLNISVGQVCAPEGLSAKASDGQTYICKKSDIDSAFRWIKQG